MTEEENPLVLFLCVGLTVGALIIILFICGWCHSRKKESVPSSQSVEVTASERVHSSTGNPPHLITPSTGQYEPDNCCQTAMETLLTLDEPNDGPRHDVPPNTHQSRLLRGTSFFVDRPFVSVEATVHSTIRNPPDLVTPSSGQYVPDNRWQNAMETLLMRDGPNNRPRHNGSPNTHQSRLSGDTRRSEQHNAFRRNSIDPPSYESLQNIPANNNATDCSDKDSHIDSRSHQPATSSTEAGNQNTVYQPADYEPPPPEYGTVVNYKDIYSVADD